MHAGIIIVQNTTEDKSQLTQHTVSNNAAFVSHVTTGQERQTWRNIVVRIDVLVISNTTRIRDILQYLTP